mgnify:FL=1
MKTIELMPQIPLLGTTIIRARRSVELALQ